MNDATLFGTLLLNDLNFRRLQLRVEQPHGFNIFEAIGMTRQELRHSTFLAALLDPRYPHGLDDRFVRALLGEVLGSDPTATAGGMSPSELRLDPLHVRREWQNIDILLESPADQLVVIIENKIWTGEHSNQLERYLEIVERHYRGWTIVPLFLTPDGVPPSDARYRLLDYNIVCRIIERLVAAIGDRLDAAVRLTLDHYLHMLRRHIVFDADSDAARLARRLYHDHESLIDTIIRQREQRQEMIRATIKSLIKQSNGRLRWDSDHADEQHLWFTRFAPSAWYDSPRLRVSNWTRTKLVVMFQLMHSPRQITIDLAVGHDTTGGQIRQELSDMAREHQPPFALWRDAQHRFFALYGRTVFAPEPNYFTEYTDAEIKQAVAESWRQFVAVDLLSIERTFAHQILVQ